MVNYCVYSGCTNTTLLAHQVFPNNRRTRPVGIYFVQVKRRDTTVTATKSKRKTKELSSRHMLTHNLEPPPPPPPQNLHISLSKLKSWRCQLTLSCRQLTPAADNFKDCWKTPGNAAHVCCPTLQSQLTLPRLELGPSCLGTSVFRMNPFLYITALARMIHNKSTNTQKKIQMLL